MNRKCPLFSNSFSSSSEKKHNSKKQKNNVVIDLTLSDDSDFEVPSSSSSSITRKPIKKRKINSKRSKSYTYDSDDDELSDDIFSSLPLTQNFEFNSSNEQSSKKKNVRFAFNNETDTPKKKRKEYKLSNVQKKTKDKNIETQLWIDKYTPQNSTELAVNKNKIEEVRKWLKFNIIQNRRKRPSLLILNGPSGSGKTATLKVLAEELGIEIVEWTNPINTLKISETNENFNIDDDDDYTYKKKITDENISITEKFKQFFMSANKYPSLQFEIESKLNSQSININNNYSSQSSIISSNSLTNNTTNYKYKIMLLEDVPLLSNLKTRKNFHSLIQSYFNSSNSVYSLVFIISEILSIDDDFLRRQEFSIKTYIPTSVLNSDICQIINFNPIAETFIAKALDNISKKSLPSSKHLDNTILRAIGLHTNGDIRSAINTLQFLYLYENPKSYLIKKDKLSILNEIKKERDPKFRKKGAYNLLSNISSMNIHLSLFHIIGKILYNKRISQFNNSNIAQIKYKDDTETFRYNFEFTLPEHLKEHERLQLQDEPDQNIYKFFEEIEEIDDAFKYIDLADEMQSQWKRNNKDFSLYSQYITMYGLLHAHTNPVPRSNRMNTILKPEEWSVNKLHQQNNTQLSDIIRHWSDASNNPYKMPFKTEHTSKSNVMTEIFPYLSKIISNPHHILNKEIKNSDKQFLYYVNNYTNPRNNESWYSNLENGYKLMPSTLNSNSLDDEMEDVLESKIEEFIEDNQNNVNFNTSVSSDNITISSHNTSQSYYKNSNFNNINNNNYYRNKNNTTTIYNNINNNQKLNDKINPFEIDDDEIEEIDY
ncbi:hypothetical protein PIROE2DRAFT_11725 [Piromyces sp. E2]|nr:hypothetical protein PIROE2DRAFT_11725 [Piromyces sp. E2]|eukprot:OUM62075.1 hypothetical protein PIROE2DRAFT_11725 [Piromyces sp. E2]